MKMSRVEDQYLSSLMMIAQFNLAYEYWKLKSPSFVTGSYVLVEKSTPPSNRTGMEGRL